MACRSIEKAEQAKKSIIEKCGTAGCGELTVKALDLSSLDSVRSFARDIMEDEPKIHLLINNAG